MNFSSPYFAVFFVEIRNISIFKKLQKFVIILKFVLETGKEQQDSDQICHRKYSKYTQICLWSQKCHNSINFAVINLKVRWKLFLININKSSTDSTKINRPRHNIRMYWTNFWQPTAHRRQNIFGKIPIEVCSPHLYASFGTIYAKIGQLFEV